jgi:hypothetical protein
MIFLIEGIITCGLAIISFWTLTDRPETARFLTAEEKKIAIARVQSENVGSTDLIDKLDWAKFKNGLKNPNVSLVSSFTVRLAEGRIVLRRPWLSLPSFYSITLLYKDWLSSSPPLCEQSIHGPLWSLSNCELPLVRMKTWLIKPHN